MRHCGFLDHNTSLSANLCDPNTPFGVSTTVVNVGLDLKNIRLIVPMGLHVQALDPDVAIELRTVKTCLLNP
jgi:hypothetical protein